MEGMKSRAIPLFFSVAKLFLFAATLVAQDSAHVVVAATTDVHGRAYHWNYVTDVEAPWGLTRVATVVDSLRKRYPGQVVVLDAGDLIQGNPFARYYAFERPGEPHRVVDALNAVRYDVATIGNHDFDFGLDAMMRAFGDATYPIVSGNVYRLPRDTFAFQPEAVLSRSGVRVGVTGFTTPGVMVWHRDKMEGRAHVRRIVPAADRAMRRLDAAGAELRIAAVHSGMGLQSSYDTTGIGPENVAAQLARLPVKPHVVIVGHSHARFTDLEMNGVHFFQPSPWALSVAVIHVILVRDQDQPYRVARIVGEEIQLADVKPHPAVAGRLESAHRAVRDWVGTTVATVVGEWTAQYARAEDTPIIDLVNKVQRRASGAELSATPAFDPEARLGPHQVSIRDIAALYPHENTLKAVLIDGETLRQYLERSAEYFLEYREGEPIINESVPGYEFDIVSGVDYTIDLTRPPGTRIRQVTYRGELVTAADVFSMALNSYRQGGGGGFEMLTHLPVVYDRGEDVRDLLIEEISRKGVLRTEDYFKPSWSIVPREAAEAVRNAFTAPQPDTPPYARVQPVDTMPTVFAAEDTAEQEEPRPPEAPTIAEMKFPATMALEENPLGRLVADARRNAARTHFAIVLNTALAADLPAGAITMHDLRAVLPYDAQLTKLTLTGEELRSVLEHVVASGEPAAHVSGMEVWFDPGRDEGRRIRRVRFPDGRGVRSGQTYTLATSTVLAADTAGFATVQWLPSEDAGLSDVEALAAYLQRLSQPVETPRDIRFHSTR